MPQTTKLPKVATHIAGCDEILRGGIPANRTTVVRGGPGAGKSVFALEMLYRGASNGWPGVMLSFEEPSADVRQQAGTFGWQLAELEQAGRLALLDPRNDPDFMQSGEFSINGLLAILDGQLREIDAPGRRNSGHRAAGSRIGNRCRR